MKIWLNDLKEGDEFYHIIIDEVYKCKHLGDAHNINFRMPRIKFRILDDTDLVKILNKAFGEEREAFVNQYVYDNFDEAEAELRKQIQNDLEYVLTQQIVYKNELESLKEKEIRLRNFIEDYDKRHNKKNP